MSDEHAADIDKHVRTYLIVFACLAVLTVVTVVIADMHLVNTAVTIAIGLFIATVKASLVACYFMHLIDEKKFILWILALTLFFFIVLMLLPVVTSTLNHPGG